MADRIVARTMYSAFVTLACVTAVCCLDSTAQANINSGPKTIDTLNRNLRLGTTTAVNLDTSPATDGNHLSGPNGYPTSCMDRLLNGYYANGTRYSYANRSNSALEAWNQGGYSLGIGANTWNANYRSEAWLSYSGNPLGAGRNDRPSYIMQYTSSIPLQINSMSHICRPYATGKVRPSGQGGWLDQTAARTNSYLGKDWANINKTSGWFTTNAMNQAGGTVIDAHVPSGGGQTFTSTRRGVYTLVNDISIDNVRVNGAAVPSSRWGSLTSASKRIISVNPESSSRIWIASPLGFQYKPGEGLFDTAGSDIELTLTLNSTEIRDYSGGNARCNSASDNNKLHYFGKTFNSTPAIGEFSRCHDREGKLKVLFHVNEKKVYDLAPNVRVNNETADIKVVSGTPYTVGGFLKNLSKLASPDVDWQIIETKLNTSAARKPAGTGAQTPCQYFGGVCAVLKPKKDAVPALGQTAVDSLSLTKAGSESGVHYCYSVGVKPHHSESSEWRYSALVCVRIIKAPYLQVWGNDLRVGSGVGATIGDSNAKVISLKAAEYGGQIKGTWAEYGIFAPSDVRPFASGASIAGTTDRDKSPLTFSNVGTKLGNFTSAAGLGGIPDIKAYFSQQGVRVPGGAVRAAGTSVGGYEPNVLVSNGNVLIDGDIINSSNPGALSQMVIIARNITIKDTVKRVDAWLIADNLVETCDKQPPLTTNDCNIPLVINGPITAAKVAAHRTGGENGDPAETANMRGDAYAWAYRVSEMNGGYRTVFSSELPPRY